MNEFTPAEINSAHDAKVLLCCLLDKLNRTVTEKQLYEIVLESGIMSYFHYTEAVAELEKNGAVIKRRDGDGAVSIEPTDKLVQIADYFRDSIPRYFRRKILKSALYYFARLKREEDADIKIVTTDNGCEVQCSISDAGYDIMRISLYAPDSEQAMFISEKIRLDPSEFYRNVIGYVLENEEEQIKINPN